MKKIVLLLVFTFAVLVANGWTRACDEAAVILAVQHLTPKAKSVVDKCLGDNYADDIKYLYEMEKRGLASHSKDIHKLCLSSKLKPKKGKNGDAYTSINNALKVIKAYKSRSTEEVTTALRILINSICDMHIISNIRIDNIPHSMYNFEYSYKAAEYGRKMNTIAKSKWSKTWHGFNYPRGFSAQYRAYDMKLCLDNKFAQYTQGSLADWATENGTIATAHLKIFDPNKVVAHIDYKMVEDVSYEMLIKASCRLAALLNSTIK